MTPPIQAMPELVQTAATIRAAAAAAHRRRRAAPHRIRRLLRIRRSSKAKSDSKKVWTTIMIVVAIFGPYVVPHSNDKTGIMVAFYLTIGLCGLVRIAEIETKEQYLLTILERFVPLIGALAVVLLLIVLSLWLGVIAFIIWALSVVRAFVKSYPQMLRALMNLRHVFAWAKSNFEL